jgi:hypothetical protein
LIANSGCGPTTLKGATRHADLNTTTGTYHKANMEDQLRAGLAVQGTEASHIMNPPPLERQRSKSVPPPSTYDHKMIHPTASSDTIDSNSRPTSVARKDSNRGT